MQPITTKPISVTVPQATLSTDNPSYVLVPVAQTDLQTQLVAAQADLDAANAAITNIESNIAIDNANLAAAQEKQAEKQAVVDNLNTQLALFPTQ